MRNLREIFHIGPRKWINKNKKLPPVGEYEDVSVFVHVTDGKLIGYGTYDYFMECWTYYMTGRIEQVDNEITHWMPMMKCPSENKAWLALKNITRSLFIKAKIRLRKLFRRKYGKKKVAEPSKNDLAIERMSALISELEQSNKKILSEIEGMRVYSVAGLPFIKDYNARLKMLAVAKERGFFTNNFNGLPAGGWNKEALFRHRYSDIPENYRYFEEDDSLHIPAIGVGCNISFGCVCIYKNGMWANVINSD